MHPSTQYYNEVASVYDRSTEPPGAWAPPEVLARVIQSYNLCRGRVLDIGIGTGRAIAAIYDAGYRDIVGVDCSSKMLAECHNKYPEIILLEGRFEEVDLTSHAPFGLIISSGVFEFMSDLRMAIEKAAKMLDVGGAMLFTYEPLIDGHEIQEEASSLVVPNQASAYFVPGFYAYRHRPSTIRDYVRGAGLSVALDEEFVSYKKAGHLIIYHCILVRKSGCLQTLA
jgi:predicted TPR repeat methyltransferase